jgi:guanylate kinase
MSRKQIVVLAGPTASGETTFTKELLVAYPNFAKLVTATTREPRAGEAHGVDYYFFTKEQFFEEIEMGNIIEHTHVKNRDAYYGTYKPDLEEKLATGRTVIVNTDLVGSRFFKQRYGATTIFIKPKSMNTIYERLRRREPDMPTETVVHRVLSAVEEIMEAEAQYDYVVFNDDREFSETVENMVGILKKEGYNV